MLLCLRSDIVIFGHVNRFSYLLTYTSLLHSIKDSFDDTGLNISILYCAANAIDLDHFHNNIVLYI